MGHIEEYREKIYYNDAPSLNNGDMPPTNLVWRKSGGDREWLFIN